MGMGVGRMRQDAREGLFSQEDIYEASGLGEHLEYADRLVRKYGQPKWEASRGPGWQEICGRLERIKKKRADRKLNISVIGEFSTGKSTFVNALLGTELLASSALQGTTVASTVIEYGPDYRIYLQYLDGAHDQNIMFADLESLREGLRNFTTDASVARMLRAVNVYLPSEILKNEIRIIDTPGTNVTEAWHEEVTMRTLRDMSDLSIVLTSAEKPAPETMIRFAQGCLGSILPQCVFVVTKLDLVRERERGPLLSYVRGKLESELELQDAVTLPYVSPAVLESKRRAHGADAGGKADALESERMAHADGESGGMEGGMAQAGGKADDLLRMSLQSEREILSHTARQKALAITKKLAAWMGEAYEALSSAMAQTAREYEGRLELLERSRKTEMRAFVEYEKERILRNYDRSIAELRENAERLIAMQTGLMKENVLRELESQETTEQLESYVKGFEERCQKDAETLAQAMDAYCQKVKACFRDESYHFYQALTEMYRALDIYPLDSGEAMQELPAKMGSLDVRSATEYIGKVTKGEEQGFWGGVAAGAVLGSAIAPGIGTVVGAIVGMFGSTAFSSRKGRLDRVRKECRDRLMPQLDSFYAGMSEQMAQTISGYAGRLRVCLSEEMDGYGTHYRKEVDRLIEEENAKWAAARSKADEVRMDQERLAEHEKALGSVIARLDLMGRKVE